MRDYELVVILKPDLAEESKKEIFDKIKQAVEDLKGSLGESEAWGVRDLAYKIGKSTQGHYSLFPLKLETPKIEPLRSKLKLTEGIIRFMITKI